MKRSYIQESIKKSVKYIYDNCTVIKDINFDNDIDMAKSGMILRNAQGITCLGELRESNDLLECIKVYGDYEVKNKEIAFIGEEKSDTEKEEKISRIMLNKSFDEDVFYFSFERGSITEGDSLLFVSLFEDEYYNTLLDVSRDSALYKNLNYDGVKQFHILAQEKRISISLYRGYERIELYSFESLQKDIKVLIDRKSRKILIDGHIIEYGDFFSDDPELYILFGCNMNSRRFDGESPKLKDISFGTNTGYIYCKPIILGKEKSKQKQFKVQMIAKGNPGVEVYNSLSSEWIGLEGINKLGEVSQINIRIRMEMSDRLYSLLVYEDNEIR